MTETTDKWRHELEKLYDAHSARIYSYLLMRLSDKSLAEDALQEVMLCAVRNYDRIRKAENPTAYLFQIAKNVLARIAAIRKQDLSVLRQADSDIDFLELIPEPSQGVLPDKKLLKLIQVELCALSETEQEMNSLKK